MPVEYSECPLSGRKCYCEDRCEPEGEPVSRSIVKAGYVIPSDALIHVALNVNGKAIYLWDLTEQVRRAQREGEEISFTINIPIAVHLSEN